LFKRLNSTMDIKLIGTVFSIVFLAELGDKTQLATLLFAARSPGKLLAVFAGASLALILASAIGVLAGGVLARFLSPKALAIAAGCGFVIIGLWTIRQGTMAG
jgi:putative Ca2+/H+ antiporter (TMEM165/GDT1 family)